MSLLAITTDSKDPLDLYEDTAIDLTIDNPMLGDKDRLSPGGYSLPFKLPAGDDSPKNSAQLDHLDVIEGNRAYTLAASKITFDDVPFLEGKLKVSGLGDKKELDSNFLFGLSSVSPSFKEAKLRDLVDLNVVIDTTNITKKLYLKRIVAGDYEATVNGNSFTGTDLTALAADINAKSAEAVDTGKSVPYATVISSGTTPVRAIAAPFLEIVASKPITVSSLISWVVSVDPLDELSLDVEKDGSYELDSFDKTTYYDGFRTFLAPHLAGTYPNNIYRFPFMYNNGLHDTGVKQVHMINGFAAGGLVQNYDTQNNNSIQPFLLMKWVIDKIADSLGLQVEGDFYEHASMNTRLLDNSYTLDSVQPFFLGFSFVWWKRSFNCRELVPDIKVVDFLKAIAMRYNLGVFIDSNTGKLRMSFREPIGKSTAYDDVTSISSRLSGITDNRVDGFKITIKKEDNDDIAFEENLSVGNEEESVDLACGHVSNPGYQNFGFALLLGLATKRKNLAKFGLRVFHFNGTVYTNGTIPYMQAIANRGDFREALIDDGATEGLYSKYHKYWLHAYINQLSISLRIDWPLRSLLRFDWALKRRFDRKNYFVKSFKLKLNNQSAKIESVDLITTL